MNFKIGDRCLITTDNWFFAPDGESYKAVYGTIKGIHDAEKVLGIKTNEKSTNWYVEIGNMIVAGCQIHYVIKTDKISFIPPTKDDALPASGETKIPRWNVTRIYNAD